MKRRYIDALRYESERWDMRRRWDLNLRYIAKSLLHVREPVAAEDQAHWRRWQAWMATRARAREGCLTTLAAVGDLMWLRAGYAEFLSAGVRAVLQRSRGLIANLETPIDPLAPLPRWVYETLHYNAPPEYLEPLRALGLDAVALSLCNNHALDQGQAGLARTRALVEQQGFACLGGAGEQAEAIACFELAGVRVAAFATTFGINHDQASAPAGVPVVSFGDRVRATDWARVDQLLARARAHAPALIVAVPHWGFEYEYWPDAAMRAAARGLIERGVDLILGSSPHVLQPVEQVSVDGWDPSAPTQVARGGPARAALVAYSLGNFASVMPTLACQIGGVLELGLRREPSGAISVLPLAFEPTISTRISTHARAHPLAMRTHTLAERGLTSTHPNRVLPDHRR